MALLTALGAFKPVGYQQLASLATATNLTVPVGAVSAVISVSTSSVRFRDDGTAPDSTHGVVLFAGTSPYAYTGDLSKVQFIQVAASAVMDVLYYANA